jgi:hypothetical protein
MLPSARTLDDQYRARGVGDQTFRDRAVDETVRSRLAPEQQQVHVRAAGGDERLDDLADDLSPAGIDGLALGSTDATASRGDP